MKGPGAGQPSSPDLPDNMLVELYQILPGGVLDASHLFTQSLYSNAAFARITGPASYLSNRCSIVQESRIRNQQIQHRHPTLFHHQNLQKTP